MIDLQTWQWILLALAAYGVGLSKTGIPGLGILTVAMFAQVIPSRESAGVVLPVLVCADIVAVTAYRRHAVWPYLWRLFPWAAVGVVLGYFTVKFINGHQTDLLIGAILLLLVLLQIGQRITRRSQKTEGEGASHGLGFAIAMGILAGFATMVANAAGPIMVLFLLAMRLPKMEFIGTSAWFFMVVNLFKIPFSAANHLISASSLSIDLVLAPFAAVGALSGRFLIRFINQAVFETVALVLTLAAALNLLFVTHG